MYSWHCNPMDQFGNNHNTLRYSFKEEIEIVLQSQLRMGVPDKLDRKTLEITENCIMAHSG